MRANQGGDQSFAEAEVKLFIADWFGNVGNDKAHSAPG